MADKDATLQQAASLMRQHHVGTLVTVGSGTEGVQVLGIVADRDPVIETLARGLDGRRDEKARGATPACGKRDRPALWHRLARLSSSTR
ncbi:MAG TPA: hypothetical protein VGF58_06885 [Burkholderiales bacterium]